MKLITFTLIRSLISKGKVILKYLPYDYYTQFQSSFCESKQQDKPCCSFKMRVFNIYCYTEFNAKHKSFGNLIKTINRKQLSSIQSK